VSKNGHNPSRGSALGILPWIIHTVIRMASRHGRASCSMLQFALWLSETRPVQTLFVKVRGSAPSFRQCKSLNGVGERSAPPKITSLSPTCAAQCPPLGAGGSPSTCGILEPVRNDKSTSGRTRWSQKINFAKEHRLQCTKHTFGRNHFPSGPEAVIVRASSKSYAATVPASRTSNQMKIR
jgi:hypothetical protein